MNLPASVIKQGKAALCRCSCRAVACMICVRLPVLDWPSRSRRLSAHFSAGTLCLAQVFYCASSAAPSWPCFDTLPLANAV